MDIQDLVQCTVEELEAVFTKDGNLVAPTGRFWGRHLLRLDVAGSRRPLHWVSRPFAHTPFGVDFNANKWFFFGPWLRMGRFRAVEGTSRWRNTRSVALHYDDSGLPGFVRNMLYDEIKPLGPDLCLGLGGVNRETGAGDHFFFALGR
ncbi:MAG: hypothetical protein JEZ02_17145 [Desulfatibacillum sp.]|nr:hypothetical protein [Desulfatibacillum sp.]